jgi:hypothetical protein
MRFATEIFARRNVRILRGTVFSRIRESRLVSRGVLPERWHRPWPYAGQTNLWDFYLDAALSGRRRQGRFDTNS